MRSEFLQEQKRYTRKELCGLFHCPKEQEASLLRKLKEFGILKMVKASDAQKDRTDLTEEDIELADAAAVEGEYLYVVTFVGVILAAGCILKCYPKYLLHAKEPTKELKQVLKVLEKYHEKEQVIRMFEDNDQNRPFHLLAIVLFLLHDYEENGPYGTMEERVENNGPGEILWDRTINETFAILSGGRPYYPELKTKQRRADAYDYIRRLHACVLTKVSGELQNAGLLELFELEGVELSEETLESFGDREFILSRIEKELNIQFHTRKQLVLKAMHGYIGQGGGLLEMDGLSLFGTNSFHRVWERVCADILGNQLEVRLEALKLPIKLQPGYDGKSRLIDLIEKPLWTAAGRCAKDTLIPDLAVIERTEEEYRFLIFDAKYYNVKLRFGQTPKGQPGIESVTKQYLYQLAYQKFLKDHRIASVRNCFLMPTEEDWVIEKGEVSLDMLGNLGLQGIQVRLLPAKRAYDCYLSGRKMDLAKLEL